MEKKELPFFLIDDTYYGGDQNWHTHYMMRLGGCSAVCACEACISLAKDFPALRGLYPFDPARVTKGDFLSFFEMVYKYIYPGIRGLDSAERFLKMLGDYIASTGVGVGIESMSGTERYAEAERFVVDSIDRGVPVMYLLLKHQDAAFDDYEWHWFNVTGYERQTDGLDVKIATWGKAHTLHFKRMWETGKIKRGGMVRMCPARTDG